MGKTILFLYGTLKRGQKNHHFLRGQEFIGEAATMPLYRLYAIEWYPGMVLDQERGLEVKGELWAVDDDALAKMDAYEGVPDWFVREDVVVRDRFDPVQAYLYNQAIPRGAVSGGEWPFAV